MNTGGRGNIACTPEKQQRIVWLVSRGWTFNQAGDAVGISGFTIIRQGRRDPSFRRELDNALATRRARP